MARKTSKAQVKDVFDRLVMGAEDQSPIEGQTEISDFIETPVTGTSEKKAADPVKVQKKSFCFRADPELIKRWKIFAAESGITIEQLCVTAIEEHINRTVRK